MHEMSIALSIAENVKEVLLEHGDVTPISIRIRIGCLAGIVPDVLRFSFGFAATDILGCSPGLEIEEVLVSGRCLDCGEHFTFDTFPVVCPSCGKARIDHTGGRDLELVSLEVEDNNEGDRCQTKDPESQ